jgi:predicted ester cyclase
MWIGTRLAVLAMALAASRMALAVTALPVPGQSIVAGDLSPAEVAAMRLAALRYDGFWNNGDESLARLALAADFIDRTLPPGRVQGVEGPLAASRMFRAAVPDLQCEVEQLILAGDRAVVHLHFRGHFTGRFGSHEGKGQPVDFIATDIYCIRDGRITDNWHLEDNLTLMHQLGVVSS